jgi:hypothetical protein
VYEDVNTLLNGGLLAGLFSPEELGAIVGELTPKANSVGAFTSQEIQLYFVSMCQKNLHFIVCMSPLSASFRCAVLSFVVLNAVADFMLIWSQRQSSKLPCTCQLLLHQLVSSVDA